MGWLTAAVAVQSPTLIVYIQINFIQGEPPPVFTWWKDGRQLITDERYLTQTIEYQGGATAVLQINKTQVGATAVLQINTTQVGTTTKYR